MMGTRAAAFAGKISNLRESILRIQNGTMPQPTCIDLANMMKYFCQVLHDFRDFKDIENVPLYANEKRDQTELIKTLPNFDYCGLYKTLTQLVDILPLIPQSSNGLDQVGSNLLMLFKCLVPFLDQAHMETMPYLVATLFMSLPAALHKEILDTLCFNLLPFTIDQQQKQTAAMLRQAKERQRKHLKLQQREKASGHISGARKPVHCIVRIEDSSETTNKRVESIDSHQEPGNESGLGEEETSSEPEDDDYALLSVTSILMIAFHYISEPMHHSQLVECLMKLKSDVFEDLLYVIAYGTTRARCPAVEVLFRYWPDICPNSQDRKNSSQGNKLKHISWLPNKCQNKNCSFTTLGDDEAVKMFLDFKLSISLSGLPPPMLVCLDCVDSIYKQQLMTAPSSSNNDHMPGPSSKPFMESGIQALEDYSSRFIDLLLPMDRVSKLCENKKCKSSDKSAIGTCFDIECANYNGKKPIRYCKSCFVTIHEPCEANNYDMTLQSHIRHSSMRLNIMDSEENVNNFIEAIISLLKEAAPADRPSKDSERYLRSLMGPMSQFSTDNKDMNIATEEKQLISQYGIWLMTGLCKKVDKVSDELLGRLLGMLFQWFHFTACLPDDQAGSALEKLKGECIKGWIMSVKEQRLDVFISCLLPHPIDCSKIGGHWEVWPDTAHQIKEGFKRLLCLVPYDIITDDVWDEIMPYWMECFRHEVPENELSELKILLSKVFDPELSPLGFETKQMYNFISSRFEDSTNTNQEQTLYWLQIITMLEIPIPIDFLFQMLKTGVRSLAIIRANELKKLKLIGNQISHKKESENAKPMSLNGSRSQEFDSIDRSSASDDNHSQASSEETDADENGMRVVEEKDAADDDDDDGDDVMLPSEPSCSTQQERQAQARAAFSAKLMQQASLLDSQTSTMGSVTSSVSDSNRYASTSGKEVQPATSRVSLAASSTASAAAHSVRLKSTASSLSTGSKQGGLGTPVNQKCTQESRQTQKRSSKSNGERLKLKVQLSAVDEIMSSNKIDNNLVCYILMMDILLKQLDLQEFSSHRGLEGREAQQAIELLNSIISTPWLGHHTCCDSIPATQVSPPPNPDKQQSKQPVTSKLEAPSTNWSTSSSGGNNNPQVSSLPVLQHQGMHAFGHCAQGFEHEDTYETCVFCEIISTFHQLAMFLIEFFSPVIEVSICEVSQDAANGEFQGAPDYSRIGLDHLGPSPKLPVDKQEQQFTFNQNLAHQNQQLQQQQHEPPSPFSPSYSGPALKAEVLESLPKELQLTYNLLVQFHQYQTPDIVSQLLQMIKLISLHSQVLSKATKNNPHFISWCQHNMLVNKLWSLCQLESSEIARTCVPLLMHCITLPWGVRLFRDLVERDFNSEDWLSRFKAVERVVTIAYFCEPSTIKNSTLLQSTMASAFCYVVKCLDDIEAIVAQRALVSLEMMKTSSLKLLLWCLEVQFDYIIADRPIILRSVFQLYNHLRDRRFLTWDFFLNRFDTIFLESQIYLQQTGEIPSFTMQDLKNTNTKSEIYQKKILRAKEALQETHHSRSLSSRFPERKSSKNNQQANKSQDSEDLLSVGEQSLKLQEQMEQTTAPAKSVKQRRAMSPGRRVMQHGKSTSSRYQSVAFLTSQSMVKRKNSKFMANLAMQSVPPFMSALPDKLHQHLPNSFVDDGSKLNEIAQENHVFGVVHRVCDEDRDTTHSLMFLLMQFFSKPDPSHPQSIKTLTRSHQIVLRHLNILMGYSIARKNFLIPATNLRLLPVFNAFLTSLPKVLDFNYSLGTILLDTCLPVLIYAPAPEETQYDAQRVPNYSLWLLNPLLRQSWLMAVMTFLYKYQFNQPHLKDYVFRLMWIVINTLESHLTCSAVELNRRPLVGALLRDSTGSIQQVVASTSSAADASSAGHQQPSESSGDKTLDLPITESSPASSKIVPKVELIEMNVVGSAPPGKFPSSEEQSTIEIGLPDDNGPAIGHIAVTVDSSIGKQSEKPSANLRQLIKADTSDSLNVKAKLFQRKSEQPRLGLNKTTSSAGTSSTKLNLESKQSSIVNTCNERLLPIGPKYQAGGRSIVELPASERLLPIGGGDIPTVTLKEELPTRSAPISTPVKQSSSLSLTEQIGKQQLVCKDSVQQSPVEDDQQSPAQHQTQKSTGNRRRFGGQKDSANKQQDQSEKSSSGGRKANKAGKTKEYVPPPRQLASTANQAFASPSVLNEQLALINRHSLVQEFSDKDLSMCLVILETFIHHEPSMAAQMLPNILRLVARYSTANSDSWQSGSNAHQVGGSMFVARQFIRVALHDLMENNIFHQIFTSHFTGYEFYKSMATALADFADLNQLAPLSKLFEDLNRQKNLPQVTSLMTILENVATYFECIIAESSSHSQTTWTNFIYNWENFLRKLILALPRYSGSNITTTTPSSGRADGHSSMAHANNGHTISQLSSSSPSSAHQNPNQFLVSPRQATGVSSGSGQIGGAGGAQTTGAQQDSNTNMASASAIPSSCSMIMTPIMRIILSTSKISHLASCKTIVDPYSKIISYTVLNSSFRYEHLLEINHNCARLYGRDREKYLIQRTIAYELVQVLKFRFFILEENLLVLLQFVLQDVQGSLAPKVLRDSLKIDQLALNQADAFTTNVSECLRQYIGDLLEFITDVHAISRINDNLIGMSQPSSINRDSFGGHVKAAISQYLALEMSLSSGASDNRTVLRYLPWLYTSPSLQQGPREFIDCVSHIRQLSWIILGSLQHSTLMKAGGHQRSSPTGTQHYNQQVLSCQPIPIEKNGNVAEHVQVILAGFAEQSKESVLHMSGLFHAFLLCQLWTMYCENICQQHQPNSEHYQFCSSTLDDFWAKITPGVLRLVGHSRVMSEMVSTHFLQLIESLIESNSSILIKYLPMWNSVFYSYKRRNKSGNLAIRLQKCIEWQPPELNEQYIDQNNARLINWLEKVQYKMSHIEIQSSQAAPFYLT